ncbi:centrosomal protein of 131 kDa-like [Leguminivora glycinivorella]|uniref:centrosomal protein of 131 kDa-like n=1 Tax=Leguminivora glycinivorella TaxID=1035111 RepID=UPI00200F0ECC|nr:centrosomal protein of 131 kDa-like [Leguminivora glycinivorella]
MSKDNANLRLLGSPVNLSYRNKKKDDRKNIRNRPRSALQNSCFTPDFQESYKRPFSADAKERAPSTRTFLKTFSAELLESYNISATTIKVLPPTAHLLGDTKINNKQYARKDKDLCSNASDYGSEDTFISLGTKIKAKAQLSPNPKPKNNNQKFLKYRNIARKGRRVMDAPVNEDKTNEYGLEVKIIEKRPPSPTKSRDGNTRCLSPSFKTRAYESYFVPLEPDEHNPLAGRVSFGEKQDVENAIDVYSRRLMQTKQQLSLVEEESTQDLDSVPSNNLLSLSPENSLGELKNKDADDTEGDLTGRHTYDDDQKEEYPKASDYIAEARTYNSFYDDFRSCSVDDHKSKMSSTIAHTDSSSKDSGYPSSANDDKCYKQGYSLPTTSILRKSNSDNKIPDQPKSLDSISTASNEKCPKVWAEPLNHSRLLYKDFFLKKEGHIAVPPSNSPIRPMKHDTFPIPGSSDTKETIKTEKKENLEYPTYLLNSSTKAYTSKVIEDYKKELEAINNLHELTIKDMQTDAISPTPLNIDKMFEQHSYSPEEKEPKSNVKDDEISNSNNLDVRKKNVSKLTTKELIQNYLKVKGGNTKEFAKNLKKFENIEAKYNWNNKSTIEKRSAPVTRNLTQRNMFTIKAPMSARIEGVNNDKDIDSWMSLSAPSPRVLQLEDVDTPPVSEDKTENEITPTEAVQIQEIKEPEETAPVTQEPVKPKELTSNSTVLDIYSMLKDIESFGENPVTSVTSANVAETPQKEVKEEKEVTPKDNFMEIFEFLEKVEQSANDALSVVTSSTPQTIPKLEALLKLPHTEIAQRLVTASLQLEERSCCIALLQESLANHKEQMINKVSNLEKQSIRNISRVKAECEEAIKRHQAFIDQLINDKKTLNHRIEQLVDERRSLEERWKRSAQALEDRYKLELRNQHDKMAAAQQVARQRWVRQKAEKIKELTVKGLEGELREMAERQQKEIADLKMHHAEQLGRAQAKHCQELEALRRDLEAEKEAALVKERQLASSRLEKQILELELSYQEQRRRLVAEMRAENERVACGLSEREKQQKECFDKWKEEQENFLENKKREMEQQILKEREKMQEEMKLDREELEQEFEQHKKEFEAEQQLALKKKVAEIAAQHKRERDREIECAIERMEEEAQAGRKELQEAIRRNKEQHECELRELAKTEEATLRRYQDVCARLRQAEDRCAELEIAITQLETRNKVITEKNSQLEASAEHIRTCCEQVWEQRVETLKKEMEVMKKTHEEQMHQLYAKVKVAVARKDSAIQALTRETAKYQEKVAMLEQKLQQQRKDFLKQK